MSVKVCTQGHAMAYVQNKDQTPPRFGYKWSDLMNDASDFIKLFVIYFIVCCFGVYIFIFNIFRSKITTLISMSSRNLFETSVSK
jgi:hypothetical protein